MTFDAKIILTTLKCVRIKANEGNRRGGSTATQVYLGYTCGSGQWRLRPIFHLPPGVDREALENGGILSGWQLLGDCQGRVLMVFTSIL